ncbi:Osmolarity sensor protein EnvZ (plasmid) [Sulfitobacter indolifex]|nr:Osmolarity sensor protein EnvZ [Sulfitobacter indolifex]
MKYGNEARVSAYGDGRNVVIQVMDTGPGIPEEEMALVLRPFYRGSQAECGPYRPRSAQVIVEDHGGELKLSNRDRGGLKVNIVLSLI